MQSETLAQEFARLVKEYHEGDDRADANVSNGTDPSSRNALDKERG